MWCQNFIHNYQPKEEVFRLTKKIDYTSSSTKNILKLPTKRRRFTRCGVICSNADLMCKHFRQNYVEHLTDRGVLTWFGRKDFLPRWWKHWIKPVKSLALIKENREIVNIKCIIPFFARNGYLSTGPYFGIVKCLSVDVLVGTSFIDRCICRVFSIEVEAVLGHLNAMAVIKTKIVIDLIYADTNVFWH